jgi:tripartite-type tricarboxylate transporter receptor subunit TctC
MKNRPFGSSRGVRAAVAAWAGAAALAFCAGPATADPIADFYKGKQVQVIVGYGTGGGYDVYARVIARHYAKHLPGAPTLVVQNMPGAGSLRAANHLYVNAPKDGTAFGTFARNMPLLGVLGGNKNVQFDPRKFTWLGSPSSAQDDAYMLFVRKDSKVNTIEKARDMKGEPLVIGGTAEGATGNDIAYLIRDTVGLNLKLIAGYPDGGAIFIAIERAELDGRFVGLSAVASNKPEWLKPNGIVKPLLQFARSTRHPDYPDAPTARELAKDPEARKLIELAEIPYMLSRPYAAPPGVPADRAAALQKAFMETTKDKEFLSDAAKLGLDVSPVGPDEAMEMLNMLADAPENLKEQLRKLQTGG